VRHQYPELATIDPELINEHPQILAIVEPRIKKLIEIGTHFLDIIIGSIHEVPFGIRWICKQIRGLTIVR
jgi:Ras GTPase-activating-like protein IQGAP2/3